MNIRNITKPELVYDYINALCKKIQSNEYQNRKDFLCEHCNDYVASAHFDHDSGLCIGCSMSVGD